VLQPFTLHRPRTADEACALLARFGEDAVPYAGGTELLLIMKMGFAEPRHLVDVKRIAGLDGIDAGSARMRIGATVTHRAVERSTAVRARCPVLAGVARHIANVRVRNVGTVGGNLAFADPHSDLATLLLVLDGEAELVSPRGRRTVPIGEFVRGPWETVRAPDELLAGVSFTPWPADTAATYVKFGVNERPTLGIALALVPDRGAQIGAARLAVGCVNPRPMRVEAAEARLSGVTFSELGDVTAEVARLAAESVDAVDDLHGSADYKREMVAVFTRRALATAAARATGAPSAARYPHTVVA
jgi:carbon-monoxide dehydrogenase medium subunit